MGSKLKAVPFWRPWLPVLFLGLVLLNSFLVSPFIGWYDTGEMIGVTQTLGISHPSGQVLYHLLGKLFLALPLGTAAWRLGMMSTVLSALAACLFFLLASRLVSAVFGKGKGEPSTRMKAWVLLLTLCWSLSLPWWRYSLMPLVYSMHLFLALFLIWVLGWTGRGKWPMAFLVLGLATVFRPTQFFALPFVGLVFLLEWWRIPGRPLKGLLQPAAFFVMGRSIALYLPLRSALHPAIAFADIDHPVALFRQVMALKFSKYVGTFSFSTLAAILKQMASHLWTDLTLIGLALLALGVGFLWARRDRVPAFLWVALAWGSVEALFVLTIPYPTFESHQTLLGWAFLGLVAVLPLGWWDQRNGRGSVGAMMVSLVLVSFLLLQLANGMGLWERKKERGAEDFARNLLTIMAPGALYVPTEENEYFPVAAYQQAYDYRKDVEILEPGLPPAKIKPRISESLSQGRPLYVTRQWVLPPGWGYSGWGPLMRIVPLGARTRAGKAPSQKPIAAWGGLELLGVDLVPPRIKPGAILELHYHWARRKPSPQDSSDMVVGVFIDAHGSYWMKDGVFWLHDIHEPPSGMRVGDLYEERRILFIPSDFPPGDYALALGLQRKLPPKAAGQEGFSKEFYERAAAQDLDKFIGRGQDGATVQFSQSASGSWKEGLWPVTRSLYPIADPRFVPVAALRVEPRP